MSDMVARISGVSTDEVQSFQRNKDAELYRVHGYHPRRFSISFEETAKFFLPERSYREKAKRIRAIAEAVFESDAVPAEGIGDVLAELSEHAHLGIITSGHVENQRRKLASFDHIAVFGEHVQIVDQKNAASIEKFCTDKRIDIKRSWMVGDSLRSDIIPARQVGLNAVHFANQNWHEVETSGHSLPPGAHQVDDIRDVPNVILSSAQQTLVN